MDLTSSAQQDYAFSAGAKSPVGIRTPQYQRHKRAFRSCAFFMPVCRYGRLFEAPSGGRFLWCGGSNLIQSATLGLEPFGGSNSLLPKEKAMSKHHLDLEDDVRRYLHQIHSLIAALTVEDSAQYLSPKYLLGALWLLQDRVDDLDEAFRKFKNKEIEQ